jgi:Tol biopolymer transport system component
LKKVSIAGGPPLTVCQVTAAGVFGAAWMPDGTILFVSSAARRPQRDLGLWRVSANGGTATAVTSPNENQNGPRWPELLPDGKTLLVSAVTGGGAWPADAEIFAQSVETGERHRLVSGIAAHYVASGHLIYTRSGFVFAVPFDLTRLRIVGDPTLVLQGVQEAAVSGPQVAVSRSGTLAYVPALPEAGCRCSSGSIAMERNTRSTHPTACTGRLVSRPTAAALP